MWSCGRARGRDTTRSCFSSSSREPLAKACGRLWPPSTWRHLKEFVQIVERGKKEGRIPPHVDSEQVAWFITGFAFAGDVSQTMGFKHFLDPEISGRWLDVMFASFVAQPGEAASRPRMPLPLSRPEKRHRRTFSS